VSLLGASVRPFQSCHVKRPQESHWNTRFPGCAPSGQICATWCAVLWQWPQSMRA